MSSVFAHPALRPVTLCGRSLPHAAHICAFFDSRSQEYDCILPYFREGLDQGEQVVSIRDAEDIRDHATRVGDALGDEVGDYVRSGQLSILASEETYLKAGCFETERMYNMIEDVLKNVRSKSFSRVRTCGDMTWALREMPGTDELMEYESRVNALTREHDCTLMCVYDVNKFSGKAVMDVLATHPMVVMNDRIYENPYYVEPTEFLKQLLRRGSSPLAKEREPELA
ncbi:MAG TPA: MEDS domain-containing protein [Usitatibacter sp.]|nr:MEDS domain-containing protein [Usitatibacter sp.]